MKKKTLSRPYLLRFYNKYVSSQPDDPAPWGGELTTESLQGFHDFQTSVLKLEQELEAEWQEQQKRDKLGELLEIKRGIDREKCQICKAGVADSTGYCPQCIKDEIAAEEREYELGSRRR